MIDLTGQTFGRFTVLREGPSCFKGAIRKRVRMWLCKCECGNTRLHPSDVLRSGKSSSCGCGKHGGPIRDLSNQKFGRLTAIAVRPGRPPSSQALWLCRCDCGYHCEAPRGALTHGNTQSCGCLYTETRRTENPAWFRHGHAKTRLYQTWLGMRKRCSSPDHASYRYYGGRGIKVWSAWQNFPTFEKWALSNGYSEGLQIDRIDNDKGYHPSNCRWVTRWEQSINRRCGKLTKDKVREMHRLYRGGMRNKEIAIKFGLLPSHVSSVVEGRSWKPIAAEFKARKKTRQL